jgi:hypothetical protein
MLITSFQRCHRKRMYYTSTSTEPFSPKQVGVLELKPNKKSPKKRRERGGGKAFESTKREKA